MSFCSERMRYLHGMFSRDHKLKRAFLLLFCAALLFASGCKADSAETDSALTAAEGAEITDAFGRSSFVKKDARVVCCYASFAQCWMLSGGTLAGATLDAVEQRDLGQDDSVEVIGTVKSIDLEKLAALEPDYVILSADLTAHNLIRDSLDEMGIANGYFRVDSFDDYKALMGQFCAVSGREDLYRENVLDVEERMEAVRARIPEHDGRSALLIRAFSTGMKAKTDDNLAGQILKEFGLVNIAENNPSMLEDLSMEQIILEDPDYIFVVTMGDEQGAEDYLRNNVENDPAWSGLCAVKEGRYVILPQELFHYKPNNRWDESYEYLAKIIYPEIFR